MHPSLLALLLVQAAFAQTSEAALRSKIVDIHCPPLAEQARVDGDVHLHLNSGVVTLLSGHPLLAPIAVENAKSFETILGKADADVTYHFVLVDAATSVPIRVTVKRGNAFERVILRMFGLKTEKMVLTYGCQEGVAPANYLKVSGMNIEIWVYGRTRCLQTQTAKLLARR